MERSLRNRALQCLTRREYAREELAKKLAPHAQSPEELVALLDELSARQFLSNERYVDMRLRSRAPRFGNARLAYELRMQGIDADLVETAIGSCEDELTRARHVWSQKFGEDKLPTDAAQCARRQRFLASRGFSGDTIGRLFRSLSRNFEED